METFIWHTLRNLKPTLIAKKLLFILNTCRLFNVAPHLQELFPFSSDLTNPMFTTHALNVMNTLDLAVQHLDKLDILIPKLRELGQMHAAFELTEVEFQVVYHLSIIIHACEKVWGCMWVGQGKGMGRGKEGDSPFVPSYPINIEVVLVSHYHIWN